MPRRRAGVDGQRDGACDILDMDAAEHLAGQVQPVGAALRQAVEGAASGAIDAGQAEGVGAKGQPLRFGGGAGGAAACADRRCFIDPCSAAIAIDAGGGEIADPWRVERRAIAFEDRVHALDRGMVERMALALVRAAWTRTVSSKLIVPCAPVEWTTQPWAERRRAMAEPQ
jgi:hypothetical protein